MLTWDSLFAMLEPAAGWEPSDDELLSAMEKYLVVRPKTGNTLVPFRLNPVQQKYWKIRTRRDYILKARQMGFSTLMLAEFFMRCILIPNQNAVVLAHKKSSAELLFTRVRLFYRNLPDRVKRELNGGKMQAETDTKGELYFQANNSRIWIGTAGSPHAVRGSTLTMVHASEFAFWDENGANAEELLSAVLAACTPDAIVRIETTPNVAASFPYQEWRRAQAGESTFKAVFFPWYEDPAYRLDEPIPEEEWTPVEREMAAKYGLDGFQIAWYRQTAADQRRKMAREYPMDPEEGWLHSGETVFNLDRVLACWAEDAKNPVMSGASDLLPGERWLVPEEEVKARLKEGHRFVIGADPAEGTPDGDYSAIQVFDCANGEQVYAAHFRVPLYQFAAHLANLGRSLGDAELVVERNNHGHAVLQRLLHDLAYPSIYFSPDGKPGIGVTAREKAQLIEELDRSFWEKALILRDPATFADLRSYVYDEHRKPGSAAGAHDDLVSALLCANRGLTQVYRPARFLEIEYPNRRQQDSENIMVWFRNPNVLAAKGGGGWVPFSPEFMLPGLPPVQMPWRCPKCQFTQVRAYAGRVTCARCGEELPPDEARRMVPWSFNPQPMPYGVPPNLVWVRNGNGDLPR